MLAKDTLTSCRTITKGLDQETSCLKFFVDRDRAIIQTLRDFCGQGEDSQEAEVQMSTPEVIEGIEGSMTVEDIQKQVDPLIAFKQVDEDYAVTDQSFNYTVLNLR